VEEKEEKGRGQEFGSLLKMGLVNGVMWRVQGRYLAARETHREAMERGAKKKRERAQ
jgi:hypothetical protein